MRLLVLAALIMLAAQSWAGTKWALLVGVDNYEQANRITPLQGAGADAEHMAATLREAAGFPADHVKLLTSKSEIQPRGTDILVQLQDLAENAQPDDTVLFYFAGHGVEEDGVTYLLPSNVDLRTDDAFKQSALRTLQIQELLNRLKAKTIVLVFDMCRTDPTGHQRSVALTPISAQGVRDLTGLKSDGVRQVISFFGCSPNQSSYEWGDKGRGYFTYFLEQGLRGEAADAMGNVTVGSLTSYLSTRVPATVKDMEHADQTPFISESGPNPAAVVFSSVEPPAKSSPTTNAGGFQPDATHAVITINSSVPGEGELGLVWITQGVKNGQTLTFTPSQKEPEIVDLVQHSQFFSTTRLPSLLYLDFRGFSSLTFRIQIDFSAGKQFNEDQTVHPGDSIAVIATPAPTAHNEAVSRMKQIVLAALMFGNDDDDLMVPAGDTHTAFSLMSPYMKMDANFLSLNPAGGRILYNVKLAGYRVTDIDSVVTEVMFFDSLPWPDGTHLVGFTDGHVRFVTEQVFKDGFAFKPHGKQATLTPSSQGETFFKNRMHGKDHVDPG